MKLALGILFVVVIITTTAAVNETDVVNVFKLTFDRLHTEPPPPPAVSRANVETKWIEQKLDNFNEKDERTWKMRYMSNDEFYEEGAPFFIFVGGEWTISSGYITGGHLYDMAKEHKAYLFYTEHRYYGRSKPTESLTIENLKYLHVRQALEDLKHFIIEMRKEIPGASNAKVILTGGSYSATMVTWFKNLYPDLIVGSWASSAPLQAKANFVEYKEITGQSIKLVGGERCYNRINNAIAELEKMFANNRVAEVRAMLKLCSNFNEQNDLDKWSLFGSISDHFAGVVQTHTDGKIQSTCNQIMKGDNDLNSFASYVLSQWGTVTCNDVTYKSGAGSLMDTNNGLLSVYRQWFYQTCNEYGWYQTSGSKNQPFGSQFPLTLYTTLCFDAYGDQFTNEFIHSQIDATNRFFGGLEPEVKNVYMSHGQLDPWRGMGIQDPAQATIIPMYAHCKDFGSISSADSFEMRASKLKVAEHFRNWLL